MWEIIDGAFLTAQPGATDTALPLYRVRELDRLADLAPAQALRRAIPLVTRLARDFAELLAERASALTSLGQNEGPYIARQFEGRAGAWWLGYFLWAPGATTPIHDHTSWGIYCCAAGTLLEERYRRLDDGAQPNQAHLRLRWQRRWRGGGRSCLLPYAGGIHRVANPDAEPAYSIHLYGPRFGQFDGRDYDPTREYVCDRST
jgi:hypothetical protein